MKYIFLLAVATFLFSCGNNSHKPAIIKTDSGVINYVEGAFVKVALGRWNIMNVRKFKDSTSTSATFQLDTVLTEVKLEDLKDTLRVNGKLSYDSVNKRFMFNQKWHTLSPIEAAQIQYSICRFRQNPKP